MNQYPAVPPVDEVSDVLEGHLWLGELVAGGRLRFQVDGRGLVFGGPGRVFDRWDEPLPYARAVRQVREEFDAARFRDLVDDPSAYVFYGVSTHADGVTYDWDRLPPFLGVEVRSDDGFLPPDRVERVFERLGLTPVNTFRKEVPSRDFDPDDYEIPPSAWYDGPAAGVVVRNKRGGRAKLHHPSVRDPDVGTLDGDGDDVAEQYATEDRIAAVTDGLDAEGRTVNVETVRDRLVESVARELGVRLADSTVDADAFRSAVAERVSRRLD